MQISYSGFGDQNLRYAFSSSKSRLSIEQWTILQSSIISYSLKIMLVRKQPTCGTTPES